MPEKTPQRVNDFVLKLANVNGTGSASANGLVMKTIFRMGVPVAAKNFFPSNIQGLPTWYEIRVSKDGYQSRASKIDLMVAMNAQTYGDDLAEVAPGGYLLYDSSWPRDRQLKRDDIELLGVPLAKMVNQHYEDPRSRILFKNIAYVGVLSALLDLDSAVIDEILDQLFSRKPGLLDANHKAVALGRDYALEHFECPLPVRVEPMDKTKGHIVIDGNTAAAMGCLYAGASVGAWYPITPSTSLMDAFKSLCERHRIDPETGKNRFCIIQAEDELAAIGMALGASWGGARSFTPTSGPGLSLMGEFLGLAYFAELPLVLFDIQRSGPSTGLPTRTQQSDIISAAYASHGDTRHVLLFPKDPEECFYLSVEAFDLADRLQTPVMVLSDLDIGMNDWMCPEFKWDDDYRPDRGKVLRAEELKTMDSYSRYLDVDGDGICYRSYPGDHPRGAYFLRGSGHTAHAKYTEDPDEYTDLVDRLRRKWETAKSHVPEPVLQSRKKAAAGVIAYGSSDGAVQEALDQLADQGMPLDYLRIRAFPFNEQVEQFLADHDRVFVVEQNRDGQLKMLLLNESTATRDQLISVLHYNGFPMSSDSVTSGIQVVMNAKGAVA
ncbi:MAG: 2-oxoacid:acceptor oxidoreductase subunit alpha [Gammaproteobacteria bacterium]|nr:2-oxoacid:acceptor oxidoreductase subunit alpha [Gammaproteobacteria bacterium]